MTWSRLLLAFALALTTCGAATAQEGRHSRRSWPSHSSPQDREEFGRRMLGHYVDRLSEAYELDDAQREQVRQRLEKMREEDRPAAQQRWQEMDKLRGEYRQLRERREAGEQIDRQEWGKLEERMRGVMAGSPLMNRDHVVGEVEKLLPAEQAAKGHQQMLQHRADEDQRRQDMRQRWEQWRAQGGNPQDFWRQQRDGGRQRGRDEGRRQNQRPDAADPQDDAAGQPTAPDASAGEAAPSQLPTPLAPQQAGENPRFRDRGRHDWRGSQDRGRGELSGWEGYVRDFTRRYQLDASQQAVAQSVLRDAMAQRKAWEDGHRGEMAAAQQIDDHEVRRKQIEWLSAPVNRIFEELKTKLDRIPTSAQRQAVEQTTPVSQPAATRPASG